MKCKKCGKNSGSRELCKECYYEEQELYNKLKSSLIDIHINHINLGKGQIVSAEYNQYTKTLHSTVKFNQEGILTITLEKFKPTQEFEILDIKKAIEKSQTYSSLTCKICGKPTLIENGKPQKQNLCYEHAQMLEIDYRGVGTINAKEGNWLFFTKCYCCGNESDDWLCDDCKKLKKKGEVVKCYNCGEWYKTKEGCPSGCKQTFCTICGKDSKGKELCKECYKNKQEKQEATGKLKTYSSSTCPICGEPTASSYGTPRSDKLCEKHEKMFIEGTLKYDEEKDEFFFDNEEYLNQNYFRIVAYNEEKNKSAIIDTLGVYDDIRKFIDSAKKNGYKVLNLEAAKYFSDGNIPKIEKENFIEFRATEIGIPQYISETFTDFHSTLIKIGDKYFTTGHCADRPDLLKLLNANITSHKTCLLCSNTTISEEHLFCPSCYNSYKNKKLFLEISANDNSIKLLDATYEGQLECDDGHIVKSQPERDIDNYLFEKNIKHGYETVLPVYDNGKRIELRPDFCIFDGDEKIYIEYWGIEDDPDYEKRKEFKMPLYKKAGITLINMYKKTDIRNIRASLEDKLKHYKKGQINFEE